jgi:hypothetical protein
VAGVLADIIIIILKKYFRTKFCVVLTRHMRNPASSDKATVSNDQDKEASLLIYYRFNRHRQTITC